MKFLCGSCRTKYQISDEKVRGKILTIRCKKCGAKVIVKESLQKQGSTIALAPVADEEAVAKAEAVQRAAVSSSASRAAASASLASAFEVAMGGALDDMPTSIAPTPANEADAGVEWYVAIDGAQTGPYAYAELVRKLQNRDVIGRHYVWHDGFDNWKRVRDVADLIPYLPPDPKKKPPPPPPVLTPEAPPQDANKVVDFAQKRAERERKGTGTGAPDEVGIETGSAEARTAKSVPVHARSDRLEQLDHVLNEALGIEGEGKTTRTDPHAAGVMGSPVGRPITGDAFSEESHSDSFIPENLFDAVPRASAQEMVGREATRFFVAAAGVNSQKSKQKLGMLVGVGAAVAVLAFFALWAGGVIEVTLPGIGNPFARTTPQEEEETITERELSPDEERQLKEALGRGEQQKVALERLRRKRKARPSGPGLPGDYVQDEAGSGAAGTRGGAVAERGVSIDEQIKSGSPLEKPESDRNVPQADVRDVPRPETGQLDAATIRQVIQDGRAAVSSCYQTALKGNDNLKGKLEFIVTVQPSGEVSKAAVQTTNFKGTALGQCIADKIKDWKFPRFGGEPQQIVVPFVLERASY